MCTTLDSVLDQSSCTSCSLESRVLPKLAHYFCTAMQEIVNTFNRTKRGRPGDVNRNRICKITKQKETRSIGGLSRSPCALSGSVEASCKTVYLNR